MKISPVCGTLSTKCLNSPVYDYNEMSKIFGTTLPQGYTVSAGKQTAVAIFNVLVGREEKANGLD
jgi:hypothetical protein